MSTTNPLADMADKIRSEKDNGVKAILTEVLEEFKVFNNKLPETIFKEFFVNYFFNKKLLEENPGVIVNWIGYAGGQYNEVDIIDAKGNVLFTVPALYSSTAINYELMAAKPFSAVAANYHLESSRLTVVGNNYLANELARVAAAVSPDAKTVTDTEAKWKIIYNYYYGTPKKVAHDPIGMLGDMLDFD